MKNLLTTYTYKTKEDMFTGKLENNSLLTLN
ncbi:Uncharacterised protein [Serratia quinivorans]|nr:Uncharacterised protein [Serratia quinivorans]